MKKIRILLINPSYQPHWSRSEPTGLLYIASYLKKNKLNVKIIDQNVEGQDDKDILKVIEEYHPDFIGFSVITRQVLNAFRVSKLIKEKYPKIVIVYGGVHATILPEQCIADGLADFVVLGEGENTFYELIKRIENKRELTDLKGLYYNLRERVIKHIRPFEEDLDSLPFPDYSLLDLNLYNTNIHIEGFLGKTIHMLTSRGCIGNCYYCCSPILYKQRVRFRSAENVVNEIQEVIKKYKIKNIHFHDDDFLLNPLRVTKICQLIIKRKLKIKWICLARADVLVKNNMILPIMKQAGCVGIEFGVEAGDNYVLNRLNKNEDLKQIYLANQYIKKNDLYPMYLIMSYSLGENIDSPYKTAKLYYELKLGKKIKEIPARTDTYEPDLAGHLARPSPGSVFYDIADKKGVIFTDNWDDHIEEKLNFIPNEFIKDIAERNKEISRRSFLNHLKRYNNNLRFYINQNFYISNYIMDEFFENKIVKLVGYMFEIYEKIDGKTKIEDLEKKHPANKRHLIKLATAISMLSIFRFIKSKNV